jgi:hypothetical protein
VGGINSDQHLGTEEEDKRRRGGGGGGLRKIRLVVMYVCMYVFYPAGPESRLTGGRASWQSFFLAGEGGHGIYPVR